MNLLLLLSALLSALTGVGGPVRAPGVAHAVASRIEARNAPAPRQAATVRPTAKWPSLIAVAVVAGTAAPLLAAEPLWASRRRE